MKNIIVVLAIVFLTSCCTKINKQIFLTASEDTYINQANLIAKYSKNEFIQISTFVSGDQRTVTRGFLNFKFSEIPEKAIIDSAFLFINSPYEDSKKSTGDNALIIQQIIEAWQEGSINWNNQPNSTETGQVELIKSLTIFQDYQKVDVTEMVKNMYINKNPFGFLIKMKNEELRYAAQFFASSNNKDSTLRPALKVVYTNN